VAYHSGTEVSDMTVFYIGGLTQVPGDNGPVIKSKSVMDVIVVKVDLTGPPASIVTIFLQCYFRDILLMFVEVNY
jgi:hypothetical protein